MKQNCVCVCVCVRFITIRFVLGHQIHTFVNVCDCAFKTILCDSAVPDQSHKDLNLVSQIFLSLVPTNSMDQLPFVSQTLFTESSRF